MLMHTNDTNKFYFQTHPDIRIISIHSYIGIGFAQDTLIEVKRSNNKVLIDGEKYYIHIVKKGETLYSISKAYNILQKEIALENPGVFHGLKEGQSLKIPIIEEKNGFEEESSDKFIFHTVGKNQTLYSLSIKYNVSVKKIIKYNPDSEKSLQIGQILKIPKAEADLVQEIYIIEDDKYFYYEVEKKQTLFSLSKMYDVEIEKIINANPVLKERGLKVGEIIKIPKVQPKLERDTLQSDFVFKDTLFFVEDTLLIVDSIAFPCDSFNYDLYAEPFNVALLMPFYLEANDTIEVNEGTVKEEKRIYPNLKHILELYEGTLLAIDSLRKNGLSINIYIYDTKNDTNKVNEIIKASEFEAMDLIIGPVYSSNLRIVADFAKQHKINIVSPLSPKSDFLSHNPYTFQVYPSLSVQLEQVTKFLYKFREKNIIVVHNEGKQDLKLNKIYKKKLIESFFYHHNADYIFYNEVSFKENGIKGVKDVLSDSLENIIIIPSTEQVFVSDIIAQLNNILVENNSDTTTGSFEIILFGFPAWKRFESIETEYLHDLQLHLFTTFYVDYSNENVKNFIRKYRKIYKAEPTRYSFQGYDIMFYFLNALKNYGKNFHLCLSSQDFTFIKSGLQSDYNFIKIGEHSGFENNAVSIIKYDKEFNVVKVDTVTDD